jgi:S-adenosylmethionine synthetase
MRLTTTVGELVAPDSRTFEVVERKGIGHPDTMSDLIAEQFSYRYSQYCADRFGQVLNHAVDKVTLVGASVRVRLGTVDMIEPGVVMLIGKVAPSVGSDRIPLHDLLRQATEDVIEFSLIDSTILRHLNLVIHNSFSSPADRSANFYLPESLEEAIRIGALETGANDTVFCTGMAGTSRLERLAVDLELCVTAPRQRRRWPQIGTDVKVMAARSCDAVDVTMCVPVNPMAIESRAEYDDALQVVSRVLQGVISASTYPQARLTVNSKDCDGGMYLAPFGTSLGKSDCGAVGRGNRREGFIAAFRPTNVEAPAGKNPLHHAGKLYTIAAQELAQSVFDVFGRNNATSIVAQNGGVLDRPAHVNIDLEKEGPVPDDVIELAEIELSRIPQITKRLLSEEPVVAARRLAAGFELGKGS